MAISTSSSQQQFRTDFHQLTHVRRYLLPTLLLFARLHGFHCGFSFVHSLFTWIIVACIWHDEGIEIFKILIHRIIFSEREMFLTLFVVDWRRRLHGWTKRNTQKLLTLAVFGPFLELNWLLVVCRITLVPRWFHIFDLVNWQAALLWSTTLNHSCRWNKAATRN